MVTDCSRYTFFQTNRVQHSLNHVYRATKLAHDIRLGYSVLFANIQSFEKEMIYCHSVYHLSYILPMTSLLCSIIHPQIPNDRGALLWSVINALQYYCPENFNIKSITFTAYALDIFLSYFKDISHPSNDVPIIIFYAETLYSILFFSVIAAETYAHFEIGLTLYSMSLLLKLILLAREKAFSLSYSSIFSNLLTTTSPIGLIFAAKDNYTLLFILVLMTSMISIIESLEKPVMINQSTCTSEDEIIEVEKLDASVLNNV